MSRKYGMTLLHPPILDREHHEGFVEAYLDDNSPFLEDYVRRKVNRNKLEKWLVQRDWQDLDLTNKSIRRRQRSKSFTPIRKASYTAVQEPNNNLLSHQPSLPNIVVTAMNDRRESIVNSAFELFVEPDKSAGIARILANVKRIFDCESATLFLLDDGLTGDLYTLDPSDSLTCRHGPADHLMTGVIASQDTVSSVLTNRMTMTGALVDSHRRTIGLVQLVSGSVVDRDVFNQLLRVTSAAVAGNPFLNRKSDSLADLTRTVLRIPDSVDTAEVIRDLQAEILRMSDVEKCQVVLARDGRMSEVFDLDRDQLITGEKSQAIPLEIAKEAAARNEVITGILSEERFDLPRLYYTSSPLSDQDGIVIGVLTVIHRHDDNALDMETIGLLASIAIAKTEKIRSVEAKLRVAEEIVECQSRSKLDEAEVFAKALIPTPMAFGINDFRCNYLGLSEADTLKASLRIFTDFGFLKRFSLDRTVLCRFLLTVKQNYRDDAVQYHNWYHAFSVTQMMYWMLKRTRWDKRFTDTDCFGMMIACICHDLDHRGTNNSFQLKTGTAIGKLYATSTMERHHLEQCLRILNLPGHGILENLNKTDFSEVISTIESSILATDLALHFRHLGRTTEMVNAGHFEGPIVRNLLMTAADLGATTKPWDVHQRVSCLLAEEAWQQGDLERSLNLTPLPMFDRHAPLADIQLDFLDNVCLGVYENLAKLSPKTEPLLTGCRANRERWAEIRKEGTGNEKENQENR